MKYFKDTNGEIFAYELDGSQNHLIGNKIAITEEEALILAAEYQKKVTDSFNDTYDKKRRAAYPSVVDQLDTLYHGGYDAWKATIKQVKDDIPKP
jgi:hypothetical protein